jgi:hypothetical protein
MNISKIAALIPILFLTACAATGTPFQRVSDIPKDKGIVYVYRSGSMLGGAVHYDVHAAEEVVCDLIRNGYCLYYAKPGELELWGKTESKSSITIDVKSGQEHFVKGGVTMGFLIGRPNFSEVNARQGLEEIAGCVLLMKPPAGPAASTRAALPATATSPAAESTAPATPAAEPSK